MLRRPQLGALALSSVLAIAAGPTLARAQQDITEPIEESASGPVAERAPESVAREEPSRIAVLMLPTGGLDPALAEALTELLISAVVARGDRISIVGKEEFQAQLGRDDADTVECIESAACLGRVRVQLDVAEVIAGTIARRDVEGEGTPIWAFNLNRLAVRSGELLGRVFREVRGDVDAVIDALEESFPELYVRRIAPGRLVVRATVTGAAIELDGIALGTYQGEPLRHETLEPGRHVLRVRAPGHREYVREIEVAEAETVILEAALERSGSYQPSPLIFVGAGITAASLAGVIGFGIASQAQPDASASMRETIEGFYPARETEAAVANVLLGVAAAGAVLGVIGLLVSGEEEPSTGQEGGGSEDEARAMRAWIAPLAGGVAVGVGGRF